MSVWWIASGTLLQATNQWINRKREQIYHEDSHIIALQMVPHIWAIPTDGAELIQTMRKQPGDEMTK